MAAARRGFLKAVALAPLAPAALAAPQTPPPASSGGAAPSPAPSGFDAIAEALTEAVRREHGARLDADALVRIRKRIARRLEGAERLRRAAQLRNADPPVTTFDPAPPSAPAEQR